MLSERIKKCRQRNWKSARAFAIANDIPVSTYSAYENGQNTPTVDTMIFLADKLGTTVDYLSGRTDDMSGYSGRFPDENAEETMYKKLCNVITDAGYIVTEGDLSDSQIEILHAVSKIIENMFSI